MIDPVDSWLLFLMLAGIALAFTAGLVWRLYFAGRSRQHEEKEID